MAKSTLTESAPRPVTRPRVEQRRLATRRELLQAGRRLFADRGLYDARIEDLTGLAGISKGALYLHFRSKEELIRAVVESGFQALGARVRDELKTDGTYAELARSLVRSHIRFLDENPDLLRVFHQARGMLKFDRPEWLPLRASLAGHLALLQELLALAPSPIQSRADARHVAATLVFGTVSGSFSVRVALGDGPGRRQWLAQVESVAVAALLEASRGATPDSEED